MGYFKKILACLSKMRCRCRSGCCVKGCFTCDAEIDGNRGGSMKKRWKGVEGLDGDVDI